MRVRVRVSFVSVPALLASLASKILRAGVDGNELLRKAGCRVEQGSNGRGSREAVRCLERSTGA